MKVQLYLKNINQEMIDTGRKLKRPGEGADWVVSWPKECCILDFGLVPHEKPDDLVKHPRSYGFVMRQEESGGMFWDPRTSSVYRVDEEAYHAMLDLDHGYSELEVARRMKVSVKKVKALKSQLMRIQKKARR